MRSGPWSIGVGLLVMGGCGMLPGTSNFSFEVSKQEEAAVQAQNLAVELRIINQSLVAIALEAARQRPCCCRRDP
jgi:hypothetical protein